MPRTVMGKVSFAMLIFFVIQVISLIVVCFIDGFLAIIVLLYTTLITMPIFFIFGLIGLVKEKGNKKIIPLVVLVLGVIELILYLVIIFGYEFGG
ncbi:hypothetical protein PGH26_12545 [Sporosarcina jeotgali]|uniref:Uncharacterized protein n=1 Tax=Sporosarcina jeotgali TaxID=3020056 RepID=A0ABZ0KUJ4_9BACL|nr:hypothetical protein [Sporosarcina sp. B2O-1]WOV83699.1 hypothetical protein PGH26_12545 [Sporosarcina sp. B2O-1]